MTSCYLHSSKCISLASTKVLIGIPNPEIFAGEPSLGDYFDSGFVGDA
jgi:hypothetical protein